MSKEKQENENLLVLLKSFKDTINNIRGDLELKEYEEIDTYETLFEEFFTSFVVASMYTGDEEWYKDLVGDNEKDMDVKSAGSLLVYINDFINMSMDTNSSEQDFVIYGVERYHHRMKGVYEEIRDLESSEDIEDLYGKVYKTVKDFKRHLSKVGRAIDELIDECYESLSDYDDID